MNIDSLTSIYCDMRLTGAVGGIFEETYTNDHVGSFNISRLSAYVRDTYPIEPVMLEVTDDMIAANRMADVSMDRVHKMPMGLCFALPPLFLEMEDGTYVAGDGNHRIRRMIISGAKALPAILVPWRIVRQFRVTMEMKRRDTGVWERIDERQFLNAVKGEFGHHAFY